MKRSTRYTIRHTAIICLALIASTSLVTGVFVFALRIPYESLRFNGIYWLWMTDALIGAAWLAGSIIFSADEVLDRFDRWLHDAHYKLLGLLLGLLVMPFMIATLIWRRELIVDTGAAIAVVVVSLPLAITLYLLSPGEYDEEDDDTSSQGGGHVAHQVQPGKAQSVPMTQGQLDAQLRQARIVIAEHQATIQSLQAKLAMYEQSISSVALPPPASPPAADHDDDKTIMRQIDHRVALAELKREISKVLLDYAMTDDESAWLLRPDPQEALDEDGHYDQAIWQTLDLCLATLNPNQRQVLSLRYGLDDNDPMTLQQVADIMGITRERVRQIEAKALRILRHPKTVRELRKHIT